MILTHAGGAPPERADRWMFLSADYEALLRWREALGPEVPVGARIVDAAEGLRRPFLDLVGGLGARHDSLEWWVSRVSERNTLVSPLFLHCCQLRVAVDEVRAGADGLCVAADSWAVLEALAAAARAGGVEVHWRVRRSLRERVAERLAPARRVVRFLAGGVARRLAAPRLGDMPPQPRILLRTWADEGSFAEGTFRDRHLPGLREWLEKRGYGVVTLPVLFNPGRSHREAWRVLAASPQSFLPDGRLLRARDYAAAVFTGVRAARLRLGPLHLGDLDVGTLFDVERRRAACDEGTLDAALAARLPRRLRAAGLDFDRLIEPFENLILEKGLIHGFRRAAPHTRLVGFQHTALYPLFLCQYPTVEEAEVAPLPDRVVCNGPLFRDVLVREGLPEDRVTVGAALRYPHLHASDPAAPAPPERRVLIPLSLVEEVSVELVRKAADALGETGDIEVALKAHPGASVESLRAAIGGSLPDAFRWVEGSMGEWLGRSRVVVANASTTILEALAAGVPVAIVGREAALDFNPLGWTSELAGVVRDPGELRAEVLRLLELDDAELERYRELGRTLVRHGFAPVSDEAMEAFLG